MTVQEYVEQLLAHMGIAGSSVSVVEDDETINVSISVSEEDSGMMIGKHGDTISSMQRLTLLSMQETLNGKKLSVNVNDYLERRKETLLSMAQRAADRVKEMKRPVSLTRLKPSERRIIHMALQEDKEIMTQSEGEGMRRILVIYPADQQSEVKE